MKRIKEFCAIIVTIITLLAFTGVATAAPTLPTAGQCAGGTTKTVAHGTVAKLSVNNTNVAIAGGSVVTVTGNGNCIVGNGGGDNLKIVGNNNYAGDFRSSVKLTGTNNYFVSGGQNDINCGGSQAIVNEHNDAYKACVTL